jgi:hypothetical protein
MDDGVLCVHLIVQRDKTIRSMSVITLSHVTKFHNVFGHYP